jgi:hypothetical protein
MAVSANQLAFGDLLEDHLTAMSLDKGRHVGLLFAPRQMIPAHRRVVEYAAAVSTWGSALELSIPINQLPVTVALLCDPQATGPSVVVAVVLATTVFAPGLTAAPAAMKGAERLNDAAFAATLHELKVARAPDAIIAKDDNEADARLADSFAV